jgi:hypothetical protein
LTFVSLSLSLFSITLNFVQFSWVLKCITRIEFDFILSQLIFLKLKTLVFFSTNTAEIQFCNFFFYYLTKQAQLSISRIYLLFYSWIEANCSQVLCCIMWKKRVEREEIINWTKKDKRISFFWREHKKFPISKEQRKDNNFFPHSKKKFFCELVSSSLHESISATSQKGRRKREKKLSELSENCMKNAKRVKWVKLKTNDGAPEEQQTAQAHC